MRASSSRSVACSCRSSSPSPRRSSSVRRVEIHIWSPRSAAIGIVERKLPTYEIVERDITGFSPEGGTLRGYFDGSHLQKLTAELLGETGRSTEELYFANKLVFVYRVDEWYDRPLSGRVVRRVATRYYLSRGQIPASRSNADVGERRRLGHPVAIRRPATPRCVAARPMRESDAAASEGVRRPRPLTCRPRAPRSAPSTGTVPIPSRASRGACRLGGSRW